MMRRRSLFAGLAGLLAAPKVAAAVPAADVPVFSEWVVGEAVDITRGGFISGSDWAGGAWLNDAPETIIPLERVDGTLHAAQRLTMRVEVEGLDGIRAAADALAELRQPEPIGVAWAGYTNEASA